MKALFVLVAASVAALTVASAHWFAADPPAAEALPEQPAPGASESYVRAIARICAGALLFDHAHRMVTDADAEAVAQDIRTSTGRRLARVRAVPPPPSLRLAVARWLSLEQRLAARYASNWVRMHDAINSAETPAQQSRLPGRLAEIEHTADPLRRAATLLETRFDLPDCTGGERPQGRTN